MVTRRQLQSMGLSAKAIRLRCARGTLVALHPGVFAVGHQALPALARERAAVLACGPDAVLSHHSAAAVWGVLRIDGPPQVTVVGRNPGRRAGVCVHRVSAMAPDERTVRHGIAITSPARTVIDLAGSVSPHQLQSAFDEALARKLLSAAALRAVLARHARCPGAAGLRLLTADDRGAGVSYAGTERLIRRLIGRAGLPAPDRNVSIGRWTVDLYWPAQRVAVELDGFDFHTSRSAFERDHEKDHVMRARDIDLLRFTWRQVHGQPERTLVRITTALARPRRAA